MNRSVIQYIEEGSLVDKLKKTALGFLSGEYAKNILNNSLSGKISTKNNGPIIKSTSFGPKNQNLEAMQNKAAGIKPNK